MSPGIGNVSRINKSMERRDLFREFAVPIVADLNELIRRLRSLQLPISSWYGVFDLEDDPTSFERVNRGYGYRPLDGVPDDRHFPWFLYWEIAWVVAHAGFQPGQKVLDLGGASSLFSFYLASKGLDVTTVDLSANLVENGNFVGREMGWTLGNHVMDMRSLTFDRTFDHITSICVYEHIPMYDRVEINATLKELLVDGGRFSITFDYRNPSRAARIDSPRDIRKQFVEPSGLQIRGNERFVDVGTNYLLHPFYYCDVTDPDLWAWKREALRMELFPPWHFPLVKLWNDYTFGSLFLEKRSP